GRAQVVEYAGRGGELREAWDGLDLSRQVAVVKAVLAGATVLPATQRGRRGFDPARLAPDWRAWRRGRGRYLQGHLFVSQRFVDSWRKRRRILLVLPPDRARAASRAVAEDRVLVFLPER
ncbi:hypothetical protein, partial [Streptomyces sp. SID12501]|uniref:hypothetical protein n=1 Tax=Streptomyces sp. SID12501 TaxID=2706042 RepID=UPI0031B9C0CF